MTDISASAVSARESSRVSGKFGEQKGINPPEDSLADFLFVGDDKTVREVLPAKANSGTITVQLENGEDVEFTPEFGLSEFIDPYAARLADGSVFVRWAVDDTDPSPYEWGDSTFTEIDSRSDDRAIYMAARAVNDGATSKAVMLVRMNTRGPQSDYSVLGPALGAPAEHFNNANAIFVAPADAPNPQQYAEASMTEYQSWANGDVYGIGTVELDTSGEVIAGTEEHVWGYIGDEYAQGEVTGGA